MLEQAEVERLETEFGHHRRMAERAEFVLDAHYMAEVRRLAEFGHDNEDQIYQLVAACPILKTKHRMLAEARIVLAEVYRAALFAEVSRAGKA